MVSRNLSPRFAMHVQSHSHTSSSAIFSFYSSSVSLAITFSTILVHLSKFRECRDRICFRLNAHHCSVRLNHQKGGWKLDTFSPVCCHVARHKVTSISVADLTNAPVAEWERIHTARFQNPVETPFRTVEAVTVKQHVNSHGLWMTLSHIWVTSAVPQCTVGLYSRGTVLERGLFDCCYL